MAAWPDLLRGSPGPELLDSPYVWLPDHVVEITIKASETPQPPPLKKPTFDWPSQPMIEIAIADSRIVLLPAWHASNKLSHANGNQ